MPIYRVGEDEDDTAADCPEVMGFGKRDIRQNQHALHQLFNCLLAMIRANGELWLVRIEA
jgi:hypothetical protein